MMYDDTAQISCNNFTNFLFTGTQYQKEAGKAVFNQQTTGGKMGHHYKS